MHNGFVNISVAWIPIETCKVATTLFHTFLNKMTIQLYMFASLMERYVGRGSRFSCLDKDTLWCLLKWQTLDGKVSIWWQDGVLVASKFEENDDLDDIDSERENPMNQQFDFHPLTMKTFVSGSLSSTLASLVITASITLTSSLC